MDSKKGNAHKLRRKQQSPASFPLGRPLIGSWTLEENFPYGFVVRNTDPASTGTEYHFSYASNGWITCVSKGKATGVMGPHGKAGSSPVLCDRESTKKQERIADLRKKGDALSFDETKELLRLTGLVKEGK